MNKVNQMGHVLSGKYIQTFRDHESNNNISNHFLQLEKVWPQVIPLRGAFSLSQTPQTRGPREGPMRPANIFSNKERVIVDIILEEISTI
jgi:hypothetical protein